MCPHNKSASILDNDSVKNRTLARTNRALLDTHGHSFEHPDMGIDLVKTDSPPPSSALEVRPPSSTTVILTNCLACEPHSRHI